MELTTAARDISRACPNAPPQSDAQRRSTSQHAAQHAQARSQNRPGHRNRRRCRRHSLARRRFDLVDEITATAAERIGAAAPSLGERVFTPTTPRRVARSASRDSHYCLCIADVARAPCTSRGRRPTRSSTRRRRRPRRAADRTPTTGGSFNCCSRRAVRPSSQAADTRASPRGSSRCSTALHDHAMATTTHVLRIIRQRLQRDARELARRKRRG